MPTTSLSFNIYISEELRKKKQKQKQFYEFKLKMSHEQQNNQQLDQLAHKLNSFKRVTQDINFQANEDSSTMDSLSNGFSSLTSSVRLTSSRFARVISQNQSISRVIGLSLLVFIIFWTLFKLL
ncbi:BA75_03346T0 [Komagataella pastoris]|uniref:BA75_03346T0 n=1 Tax=Komagataella pastoris TaxID=4922 RepID=A0A1B2JGC9_PICPA|nr:BA75_03346T0 [Komagataella pastoris]